MKRPHIGEGECFAGNRRIPNVEVRRSKSGILGRGPPISPWFGGWVRPQPAVILSTSSRLYSLESLCSICSRKCNNFLSGFDREIVTPIFLEGDVTQRLRMERVTDCLGLHYRHVQSTSYPPNSKENNSHLRKHSHEAAFRTHVRWTSRRSFFTFPQNRTLCPPTALPLPLSLNSC